MSEQTAMTSSQEILSPLAVVEDIIRGRRTVKRFLPRPVPRELVASLLDTAVWAPNHRLTEPWRFYILDGESRQRVGEIAAEITRAKAKPGTDTSDIARAAEQVAMTWAQVPMLLYVTTLVDARPDIDQENYGAVCCAIQNFLLLAHTAGLAASWSSGAVAESPGLHQFVGAQEHERMAGLIRVGYPDPEARPTLSTRTPASNFTTWIDSRSTGAK